MKYPRYGRNAAAALLCAAAMMIAAVHAEVGPPLALLNVRVIDGTGAPPIESAIVLLENGRVRAVGSAGAIRVPAGFARRDARGLTLLPGLVDSHVHLEFALARAVTETDREAALSALLAAFLDHGVTTIRSVGDSYPWIVQLRDDINAGRRDGPRIFAAGPLITAPGGHPAGTLLRGNDAAISAATRQVATPEEARTVVAELARGHVDLIKVVFDSRGRSATSGRLPTLDVDRLRAVVSAARRVRLPVTVHWGNVAELPDILAARPDQLEHAGFLPMPEALIASVARERIVVDPTLVVLQAVMSRADFERGPLDNVRRLHGAGVVITAGTDTPLANLAAGESLDRELELLVEAGLSPNEAIQAATSRPAALLGRDRELGVIRRGMRADLIAVAGDPSVGISDLREVRLVIRDGRIVRPRD